MTGRVIETLEEFKKHLVDVQWFANCTFRFIDFSGEKMKSSLFKDCSFIQCKFEGSSLDGWDFRVFEEDQWSFVECEFKKTQINRMYHTASGGLNESSRTQKKMFQQCSFTTVTFHKCELDLISFHECVLKEVQFKESSLNFSRLDNCVSENLRLEGVQAVQMIWKKGVMTKCRSINSDLRRLICSSELESFVFSKTRLFLSFFSECKMNRSSFSECAMDGTFFSHCFVQERYAFVKVKNSSLRGVRILRCELPSTEFESCDMQGVVIEETILEGGSIHGSTDGGTHASMEGAFLSVCVLNDVSLERISLRNAFFSDCRTKRMKIGQGVLVDGMRV